MNTDCRVREWLLEKERELSRETRGVEGEIFEQLTQIFLDLSHSRKRHEGHCTACLARPSLEPLHDADGDAIDVIDDFELLEECVPAPTVRSRRELTRPRH